MVVEGGVPHHVYLIIIHTQASLTTAMATACSYANHLWGLSPSCPDCYTEKNDDLAWLEIKLQYIGNYAFLDTATKCTVMM